MGVQLLSMIGSQIKINNYFHLVNIKNPECGKNLSCHHKGVLSSQPRHH